MADHIKIRNASGTWVVRAGGAVLGESSNALELSEGDYGPVIYFPRGDLAMAFLEKSDSSTRCPHKGAASYFNVSSAEGDIPDAAWSYKAPMEGVTQIRDFVAFYTDKVSVEQL